LFHTLQDISKYLQSNKKTPSAKRTLECEDICLLDDFLREHRECDKPFAFILLLPGTEYSGNNSKSIEEAKAVLRKYTGQGARFRFIMDNRGENIFYIFITGSSLTSESVKLAASQMSHTGFGHIAAGNVSRNTSVAKCLHETIRLANTRFFNPEEKLLVYTGKPENEQNINIDLNELDILLEYGTWQDTAKYVKDLFYEFWSDTKNSFNLHILVRNIAIKFINCLVKYNLTIPDELKQLMNIESLLFYNTKEELMKDILVQAEYIVQCIEGAKNSEEMISSICKFIQDNYDSDLSLKSVADKFFLNPTYLSKRFKEKKKISFSRFVEMVRIEKAKELLQMTDMSITDIAQKTGYDDPNYFSRVFKKVEKKPPTITFVFHPLPDFQLFP